MNRGEFTSNQLVGPDSRSPTVPMASRRDRARSTAYCITQQQAGKGPRQSYTDPHGTDHMELTSHHSEHQSEYESYSSTFTSKGARSNILHHPIHPQSSSSVALRHTMDSGPLRCPARRRVHPRSHHMGISPAASCTIRALQQRRLYSANAPALGGHLLEGRPPAFPGGQRHTRLSHLHSDPWHSV